MFLNKIASDLKSMISKGEEDVFPVIVQVNGTLLDTDEAIVNEAGGTVRAKLSIINSYATDLTGPSIKKLVESDRIKKIFYDGEVFAI